MGNRAESERQQVIETNSPLSRHSLSRKNMNSVIAGEKRAFGQDRQREEAIVHSDRLVSSETNVVNLAEQAEVPFETVFVWEFGVEQAIADGVIEEVVFEAS